MQTLKKFFLFDKTTPFLSEEMIESDSLLVFSSPREFIAGVQETAKRAGGEKYQLSLLGHGIINENKELVFVATEPTAFKDFLQDFQVKNPNCIYLCVSCCNAPKIQAPKIQEGFFSSQESDFTLAESEKYLDKLDKKRDFALLFRGRNAVSSKESLEYWYRCLNLCAKQEDPVSDKLTNELVSNYPIFMDFLEQFMFSPVKLKLLLICGEDSELEAEKTIIVARGPKTIEDLQDIRGFFKRGLAMIIEDWPEKKGEIAIPAEEKEKLLKFFHQKIDKLSEQEIERYLRFCLFSDLMNRKFPLPQSSIKHQRVEFLTEKLFEESPKKIFETLLDGVQARSAFSSSIYAGDISLTRKFLERTRDLFDKDPKFAEQIKSKQGSPFLIFARKNKSESYFLELLELLKENDFDLDCDDENGATALMYACVDGWKNAVKKLVEYGADFNCKCPKTGMYPIQTALSYNQDEVVQILEKAGAKNDFVFRKNGDKYQGEWQKGKRQGLGRYESEVNKLILDGDWKDDFFYSGRAEIKVSIEDLSEADISHHLQFISANKLLKYLKLSGNKIGDRSASVIAKILESSNLEEIDLSENSITEKGYDFLKNALRSEGCKLKKITIDDKAKQEEMKKIINEKSSTKTPEGPSATRLQGEFLAISR